MVFLSLLYPKGSEAEIYKKSRGGFMQNQINSFQWGCIDGLISCGENVRLINCLPVGTFPKHYRGLFIKGGEWVYGGAVHTNIGGINIPFLKQISRKRKIKRLLSSLRDEEIVIYSTYMPFLRAVKNIDKSCAVTLIVTDLPEYYDLGKTGMIKRLMRKVNNKMIYSAMARADRFVLLTEAMREPLGVGDRPYTVVEGIYGGDIPVPTEHAGKTVFYAGALHEKFGIKTLLEAFSQIKDENFRLVLCGDGDAVPEIKKAAEKDCRIKFLGYIPKEQVEKLREEAALLINPRPVHGEYTKYSFPSKTMEYLASGKPFLGYRLDGIPADYDDYINYIDGDTAWDMARAIEKVCNDGSGFYISKARRAAQFIAKEKNSRTQAGKILKLIKEN